MSEFRFLCPECGQKILCDASLIGTQIPCPTCQKTLTIQAPAAAPIPAAAPQPVLAGAVASHAAPAPPPVKPSAAPHPAPSHPAPKPQEVQGRYSALAIASLLSSVFVVPGFIPGIICGHLAKARMRKDIFLEGEKLANAGLAVSYSVLSAIVLYCLVSLGVQWHFHPSKHVLASPDAPGAAPSRVVDEIIISETEDDHEFQGQMASTTPVGAKPGRTAQRGGGFMYTMKVLPHEPMTLVCRYWGSQGKSHVFDVGIDDRVIATQKLNYDFPEKFFEVEYKIPASLTRGKTEVKVVFQARPNMIAGAVFGCQMLRR